jgi:transcriptional regulator with XRE-family HTH domain
MRAVKLRSELSKFKDEHGLTNRDIAEMANISNSVISRVLTGNSNPSKKTIHALTKVLELSDNDIVTKVIKDDKPKEQTEYREINGNNGKRYLLIKRKSGEEIIEL